MQTWGRVFAPDGTYTWQRVATTADGRNDEVYLTTLAQVLKLLRNESPFYSNYGIPAKDAVLQQIFPDFYMTLTQQQFAPFFASLTLAKLPVDPANPVPACRINVTFNNGAQVPAVVPT